MYKEVKFQLSQASLTSFPSYEHFPTPVSLRFIYWTHVEWRRRGPMQLCFTLLYSLSTEFVQGFKKAHQHVLARFENTGDAQSDIKYLLCTPCATYSKYLTLLQPPLHVVNDATDPRSEEGSSMGSPVMRRENRISNSSKAAREKGNLRKLERKVRALSLGEKDDLRLVLR